MFQKAMQQVPAGSNRKLSKHLQRKLKIDWERKNQIQEKCKDQYQEAGQQRRG